MLALVDQSIEERCLVGHQIGDRVVLGNAATVHHEHTVVVVDGVDAMRYGEHGHVGELAAYGALNEVVGLEVDRGGRLVYAQYATIGDEGARQAHQLLLAG